MDRRESLAVFAGVAATLAGCTGFASSSSESSSDAIGDEDTVTDGPGAGAETDPERLLLRVGSERQPLWLADPDSDDGGRPTAHERSRSRDSTVVDSTSRADGLTAAEGIDRDQVDSFLSATDFDTETVYLEVVQVEECFELDLCRIEWQPDRVSTDYVRQGLPYDERCEVDEHVFEARLIRIPDTIEADSVTGYSSSIGTGACGDGGPRAEAEAGGSSGSASRVGTDTVTQTGTTAMGGEH